MIKDFISKKANNTLESYLKDKEKAWFEDSDGETRVYLVKDESGKIALYFSLKCGLLVGLGPEQGLTTAEMTLAQMVADAKFNNEEETLKEYYSFGVSEFGDRIDLIFEVAERKKKIRIESEETGQNEALRVRQCVSAIELRHFCKNEGYEAPDNLGVPLGFGIFWEIIVPQLLKITKTVGCKYLYLFAADNSALSGSNDIKKLVNYYKSNLKFYDSDLVGLEMVKPDYDANCDGLIQEVKELKQNRETIWYEFSDI